MLYVPYLKSQAGLLDELQEDYNEQVYRGVFDDDLPLEARSTAMACYIDVAEVGSCEYQRIRTLANMMISTQV